MDNNINDTLIGKGVLFPIVITKKPKKPKPQWMVSSFWRSQFNKT